MYKFYYSCCCCCEHFSLISYSSLIHEKNQTFSMFNGKRVSEPNILSGLKIMTSTHLVGVLLWSISIVNWTAKAGHTKSLVPGIQGWVPGIQGWGFCVLSHHRLCLLLDVDNDFMINSFIHEPDQMKLSTLVFFGFNGYNDDDVTKIKLVYNRSQCDDQNIYW